MWIFLISTIGVSGSITETVARIMMGALAGGGGGKRLTQANDQGHFKGFQEYELANATLSSLESY